MRIATTYALDRFDPNEMSPERVLELDGFVERHAPPEHALPRGGAPTAEMHPGYRALRRIKGNAFTREDVVALEAYIRIVAEVALAKADEVDAEWAEVEPRLEGADRDLWAANYAYLSGSMRDDVAWVRRVAAGFLDAFRLESLAMAA